MTVRFRKSQTNRNGKQFLSSEGNKLVSIRCVFDSCQKHWGSLAIELRAAIASVWLLVVTKVRVNHLLLTTHCLFKSILHKLYLKCRFLFLESFLDRFFYSSDFRDSCFASTKCKVTFCELAFLKMRNAVTSSGYYLFKIIQWFQCDKGGDHDCMSLGVFDWQYLWGWSVQVKGGFQWNVICENDKCCKVAPAFD